MTAQIERLQVNLDRAFKRQDYQDFNENIEILRKIALNGQIQAQAVFIDWYKRLNPAYERILGHRCPNANILLKLKLKEYLFQRLHRTLQ